MTGSRIPPLPPECLEVLRHMWDYLDAQLTDETTERLRQHLGVCQPCMEYKTFQANFLEALALVRDRPGAPPELRAKVLELLHREGLPR